MSIYRSKLEEEVALQLPDGSTYEQTTLQYAKRTNRKMRCLDCGSGKVVTMAKYLVDFTLPNGIILEVKGWLKPTDRTKMESVIKHNPDLDIRMVFDKDNWCTKLKKQKYSQWCDKRGIKYTFLKKPEVLKEWINEE